MKLANNVKKYIKPDNERKKEVAPRKKWVRRAAVAIVIAIVLGAATYEELRACREAESGATTDSPPRNSRNYGEEGPTAEGSPSPCVLHLQDCCVACDALRINGSSEAILYEVLERAFTNGNECCKITLTNPVVSNNTISPNWLVFDDKRHPRIDKLEVSGVSVAHIAAGAFTSFPDLVELTITNTNLTTLQRIAFQGMEQLQRLQLRDNSQLREVESGFLLEMKRLNVLQVQHVPDGDQASAVFFANLTGNASLGSIRIVDWQFNCLPVFSARLLAGFPNAETVNLENNGIREIETGAFDNLKHLISLYLRNNKILTLERGKYEGLVNRTSVYLKQNRLVCDCAIKWLQTFVIEEKRGKYADAENVFCDSPGENRDKPFLGVEMCPGSTTEAHTTSDSPEATTTTTEEVTSSSMPHLPTDTSSVSVRCSHVQTLTRRVRSVSSDNLSDTLRLSPKMHYFSIEEAGDGEVVITFSDEGSEKAVLWMNEQDSDARKAPQNCAMNISARTFVVDSLDPDCSYLFCVFHTPGSEINLLDCMPYTTQPTRENQTWLTMGNKNFVTVLFALTLLVAFLVGGTALYFVVRRNPVLMKGSKRVVIVKKQNQSQLMVLPKGYEERFGQDLTLQDNSSAVSYISAMQPTQLEVMQYRIERLHARSLEQSQTDIPPALPPYPAQLLAFTKSNSIQIKYQ